MKIVITGAKNSGKTSIGKTLAVSLGIPFYDTDRVIEELYEKETGKKNSFREIFQQEGEEAFRNWEKKAVTTMSHREWCIVSTGGGTILSPELRYMLFQNAIVVFLKVAEETLWKRMDESGLPEFYKGVQGREHHKERVQKIYEAVAHMADIVISAENKNFEELSAEVVEEITSYIALRMKSPNTFGEILRVTTFGESHGPALGAVLDGVPVGCPLTEGDIQKELQRRRPGQSNVTTPRNETDQVHILSGVFQGKTTGTPICFVVYNKDQDSSKYEALRNIFRPGHADFTFWKKYGFRDYRGGGRTSGRETIGRVAAGAVAKKMLYERGVRIYAFAEEIGGVKGSKEDFDIIEMNKVRAADSKAAVAMEQVIIDAGKEKNSVGGIVKAVITSVPAGLGDPVFYKLDARMAAALFSIGAVKGLEIGDGFKVAQMKGSDNNDSMNEEGFVTNHAGGILGGISNGENIVMRMAVKPTPSIFREQKTIDTQGHNTEISITGRHDPCIIPRIIPVVESMIALVLLDAYLIQENIQKYNNAK